MDITIQMRSLELLIKMLKRDMEGIHASDGEPSPFVRKGIPASLHP